MWIIDNSLHNLLLNCTFPPGRIEWRFARHAVEHEDAQRPPIGWFSVTLFVYFDHLGSHVFDCAAERLGTSANYNEF